MACVVFGASGLIGRYLLPQLQERGRRVVAVSRQVRADAGPVRWLQGKLLDAVPTLTAVPDAVICLGPLDHFSQWLEHAGIPGAPRVIAMSSMSAQSKRDSPDAAERALSARLRDAEQRVLSHCAASGSACTILRATLIYGGAAGSLERLAARARRWHLFPLPRGRGLRQPVHAMDLALAVLAALERPQATGIIEAGGGARVTATAMFGTMRRCSAPRTLGIPLPAWLCAGLAAVSGRGRGMAVRLGQDLVADNTRLVAQLGIDPRGFPDAAGDGAT